MSGSPRTRALLLRRTPFGESSLVIRLLTPDWGRVDLVAKGAYRPQSRLFATLDWFHTLEVDFRPHAQGLAPLRQADWEQRRPRIPLDRERYRAGLSMLELGEAAARVQHAEPELFAWVEAGLQALETSELSPLLELVRFELGFLDWLGIAPALESCATCGSPAPSRSAVSPTVSSKESSTAGGMRVPFSASSGGRLCAPCAQAARQAGMRVGTMPESVLDAAAQIPNRSPELLALSPPPPELLHRVLDLLGRFLDFHLESHLRSQRRFLAGANRNAPDRGPAPSLAPLPHRS